MRPAQGHHFLAFHAEYFWQDAEKQTWRVQGFAFRTGGGKIPHRDRVTGR
jgi:hypothetical protein